MGQLAKKLHSTHSKTKLGKTFEFQSQLSQCPPGFPKYLVVYTLTTFVPGQNHHLLGHLEGKERKVHVEWREYGNWLFCVVSFASFFLFSEYHAHVIRSISHNRSAREFSQLSTPLKPAPTPRTRTLPTPSFTESPSNLRKAGELTLRLIGAANDAREPAEKLKHQENTLLTHKLKATHDCNCRPPRRKRKWPPAGPPPSFRPPVSREPSRPLKVSGQSWRCWPPPPT